jgi:hypothetical protein
MFPNSSEIAKNLPSILDLKSSLMESLIKTRIFKWYPNDKLFRSRGLLIQSVMFDLQAAHTRESLLETVKKIITRLQEEWQYEKGFCDEEKLSVISNLKKFVAKIKDTISPQSAAFTTLFPQDKVLHDFFKLVHDAVEPIYLDLSYLVFQWQRFSGTIKLNHSISFDQKKFEKSIESFLPGEDNTKDFKLASNVLFVRYLEPFFAVFNLSRTRILYLASALLGDGLVGKLLNAVYCIFVEKYPKLFEKEPMPKYDASNMVVNLEKLAEKLRLVIKVTLQFFSEGLNIPLTIETQFFWQSAEEDARVIIYLFSIKVDRSKPFVAVLPTDDQCQQFVRLHQIAQRV